MLPDQFKDWKTHFHCPFLCNGLLELMHNAGIVIKLRKFHHNHPSLVKTLKN